MTNVRVTLAAIVVASGLLFPSAALAAFPGWNGELAVQPTSGRGILLVSDNGRTMHRICTRGCGTPRRPRWSPDGGSLVFAGPKIKIVYTDGSCLNCQFGGAPDPVFEASGTLVSFIEHGRVRVDGIDGLRKGAPGVAGVTDAVWSATGELAVIRRGALWAGRPGRLRRIGVGAQPSWSPSGDRLAAAQRGWVVIVRVRGHHVRRLARGSAPAFSPDGRWIAFLAPNHRLMIVAARGGRARPVGRFRAVSVDWQPKPRRPNPGCAAPPGSRVIASTADAVVTQDGVVPPNAIGPLAYMGCLRADGRERLIGRFVNNNIDGASWVTSAVLASPYAALVERTADLHYGGQSDGVQVVDLRTGKPGDGGESASCPPTTLVACMTIDHVVVGSDGVSAAHIVGVAPNGSLSTPLVDGSCAPASGLCVAVTQVGGVFTSEDPSAGPGSWSSGTISLAQGSSGPQAVTCPARSLCVAPGSDIYVSSDPAGGTAAWSVTQIDPSHGLDAVVCSTEPRCFTSDSARTVFTSSDPSAGTWTKSTGTPAFQSGACPTSTLCVTVGTNGALYVSTDPASGTWSHATIDYGLNLTSVSCASVSLCVATDSNGHVVSTTDPAGGPSAWTPTLLAGDPCTDGHECSIESIETADKNGHQTVDSSTLPGSGPFLTGLSLTGDTLSWSHNGSPRSVTLTPP